MNVILLEPGECGDDEHVILSGVRAAHLREVLRVTPGQAVRIGLVDGPFGTGTVEAVRENVVVLRCVFESEVPPRPRVDLLLALPRPKVMRRLWAQLAALGVGQVVLTNAEKVERNYFDTHVLDAATYRPLLLEGLQQARDTHVPVVSVHRQFRKLVEDDLEHIFPAGLRLIADPSAERSVHAVVRNTESARCMLAIGPEGGWNAFEMTLLTAHGFRPVSMGPRTLRTDTACVALLTLVHDALT
jgi:RsmE family RNA methyltransferase